jgi:hypothetical protein
MLAAGLLLALPAGAHAATVDEIISMQDSGLPAEVIIQVIDATGLDKPMDIDTLELLQKHGLDESVLSYLTKYLTEDAQASTSDEKAQDNSQGDDSSTGNLIGGEGFHHNGDYYGSQGSGDNGYWDGPSYRNDYYPPPGEISIYQPPVYVPYGNGYRHYYQAPRLYDYNRGYWQDGHFVIYDPRFDIPYTYLPPYGYWPYGYYGDNGGFQGGNLYWGSRHGHGSHGRGHGFGAFYHDDGFSISLHF